MKAWTISSNKYQEKRWTMGSWKNHKPQDTVVNVDLESKEINGSRRKNANSIWDEIRDFGDNATHHGVRFVTNPKHHKLRR